MVKVSVMYVGQPADPAALKRFPEFRGQIKRQIFEVKSYWP